MDTTGILILIIVGSFLIIGLLIFLLVKGSKKKKELNSIITDYENKYRNIIDVDEEINKRTFEFTQQSEDFQNQIIESKEKLKSLKEKYLTAKEVYEDLTHQNNLLRDTLEIAEFGVYEPHFDFETSEKYKEKIIQNKEQQKELIKNETAAVCGTPWTVDGSRKKGEVMERKAIKLTLRAFNGECDSLIAKVKWNNIKQFEERIKKTFEAINKLNSSQNIDIQYEFLQLKIDELRLTHEYELKKYEEKEEQRRVRELMREEEKAQRDFEKAQKEAEKEEKLIQQAMKKAQEEIAKASEEERAKYEAQLTELQEKLREAEEKNQRALSMAQQTKSGHVYVISNIGSFGENIYKIGMTRRLEPLDRVNELGDASVPFKFDVHAMIYSEDAPDLENQLHKTFNKNRLNFVNLRREYFDISLDEAVKTNVIGTDNTLDAAIDAGVKCVICLSTDKAAYPINAMGITKAIEEKIAVAKSRLSGDTKICCTRYGNVMCSRGSVIPLWIDQIRKGNPITLTEPKMTRFIMSLEEAVDLVLFAFEHGQNGDILVQKAPACTIQTQAEAVRDLFEHQAPNGKAPEIKVIGIRHGEKMYETLLTNEECAKAEDMGNFYRVPADNRDLNYDKYFKDGDVKRVTLTEFNSDNTKRLNLEETTAKIASLEYIQNELNGIPNIVK